MKNNFFTAFSVLALCAVVTFASVAHAYTTTHYNTSWCTGVTTLGTLTNQLSGSACVPYCAGLAAGCCTTNLINTDGDAVYSCTAKSQTTVGAKANQNTNNGEVFITRNWSADVINYTATIDLTAGAVTPTSGTVNVAVTLSSTVTNAGDASSGAGFTNLFQRATDAVGTNATDIGTHSATALAAGGTGAATISYTFPSAATWYVRACADKNAAASAGTITESNESNNCGAWTAITVTAAATPTATLTANPTSLSSGSSVLTLASTNATSCTGTGFTVTGTSGNFSVTPTVTTTYSVTCTNGTVTSPAASATVTKTTTPAPTVTVSSVASGSSSTITWSSTNATSCVGTNFSTGNQTGGTAVVTPTATTQYTVTCTGSTGLTGSGSTTVTVSAAPTVTSVANAACSGGTYISTTADVVNSCVSYCSNLSASCCSTTYYYGDSGTSYYCSAYTNTTATISAPAGGGCTTTGGGGGGGGLNLLDQFGRTTIAQLYKYLAFNGSNLSLISDGGTTVCDWYTNTASLISYGPAVSASLVTNPTSISLTQPATPATITWASTNATSCTGTGFSTGGATQGSVTVTPSVTTTYGLSCTNGVGGTATDSKVLTVNVFTVTCSATPSPVTVLQPVSWTSTATGGTGTYTYSWSGTDSLGGSGSAATKSYTTTGEKFANLTVTSGASSITTACNGTPCQTASCTCTAPGCGVVVQEGASADVTASIPTISSGVLAPGGFATFAASIQNIGNNSISAVFQNRFQIDTGSDGTYDVTLDTGGSSGSAFGLEYGKTCSTGTIVATDFYTIYGSGDLDSAITSLCQADAVAGQCCGAVITTGTTGGGGGGGGRGTNLVQGLFNKATAAVYKSLALTTYDIAVTVYSSAIKSPCPVGQTCYAGTWQAQAGSLYSVPYNTWFGVTSPQWSNIPVGTHKVRMCADIPSAQLIESNENNNCGPDYTFTVSGFDLVGGASGVNTGTLIGGQAVTFFGNVLNSPASFVATGQCQATVVVSSGGACSIAVNRDQIVWSTTGATIVSNIDPLTTSPTVPPTGAGGMIVTSPTELGFFTSQPLKADMLANGGVNFSETSFTYRTGNSDQVSMDRACKMITGNTNATAKAWGARGWGSCGNNGNLKFDGTNWASLSGCIGAHLFSQLDCQYPGSPYALSGSYTFPSPLGVGTHTYQLTDNATTNNTCQATIVIPASSSGLCTLTATPSIISSGGTSILGWTATGASGFSIDQGIGTVTPTALGSRTVSPTATKTYTGTATTDTSVFTYTGCAPSQFQIDQGNDGTWDTTLASAQCVTTLGVNQSTQSISPTWTAIPGTHRIRVCANTPLAGSEGDTTNNCGTPYTFTVANPAQCADGIDNNGNSLIDYPADPACASAGDTAEETHSAAALVLTSAKSTVKKGTTTTLTWSGTEVVSGSCVITSSAGDSWAQAGTSGTQTTAAITAETTYTLSCTSIQTGTTSKTTKSIKLAPIFEEV